MNFLDEEIEKIDLNNTNNISKMIVEYLCAEKYYRTLSETEKDLLSQLLRKAKDKGLNYAQFNELLLLLNQDRVTEAFFNFFFWKKVKLDTIKEGIIKFRGFAMLCFGNFRFAYKQLIQKNEKELEEALKPYCTKIDGKLKRPDKALDIEKIERDKTWYNGYITKKKSEKEAICLTDAIKEKPKDNTLLKLGEMYEGMKKDLADVEQKASKNSDIYLTWDYMDVYIATSMRRKWEFEETFDFIKEVFSDNRLKRLRYFDPTQSFCRNRIDKGLIEGLMLKRSLCTIYMAQEVDTMGKDSELAATLAQGKPVMAYVPLIDPEKYAKKINGYPLDYFKLRFLVLRAEGIFDDKDCHTELKKLDHNFDKTINDFIDELDNYRFSQPYTLWNEKEEEFKKQKSRLFQKICKILAIAEFHSYEKRAKTLKEVHPLSIQVNLASGVANGVMVVRNSKKCAELLYKVLTNSMDFTIKHIGKTDEGVTILEENISGCPFRIVTDYERLTNSFWNFYLINNNKGGKDVNIH